MEKKLLNERWYSVLINPGAKSTCSPSAQCKNTKDSEERRLSSFVFFPPKYSSLVRESKIACSCCKWRDERVKKGTSGREKAFQANCGSFSYIVDKHTRCCVCRRHSSRNCLLWAAVRK